MKQMLAFDWNLIRQKKSNCILLAGFNFIYFLIGLTFFHRFVFPGVALTIILAAMNTYVLLAMVSCHTSAHNISISNYSSLMYFPVKKSYFYGSKAIITGCILCYQCILTMVVIWLNNRIHQRVMSVQLILPHILGIFMIISLFSSIIAITCIVGRAFQIGTVFLCTFAGMIIGGFAGIYEDSAGELPYISMKAAILIPVISVVIWLIMNLLAQRIAKKVTV